MSTNLRPRRVAFAYDAAPASWIPGDPFTAHLIDSLSLLLPSGEQWFVDVYREALPLLRDDAMRAEARGFMGQEATHARAHEHFLGHLRRLGIDARPFTLRVDWMFERLLGARPPVPLPRRAWLEFRLGAIAAIEHLTCVLGNWILDARALDEAGADPRILELLRWHGAEEIEHRSVAHDTLTHVAGRRAYAWRAIGMALTIPILWFLLDRGVRFLLRRDLVTAGGRWGYRDFLRAVRAKRAPGPELARALPRFFRLRYHPRDEGSTERALSFLSAVRPAGPSASSRAS